MLDETVRQNICYAVRWHKAVALIEPPLYFKRVWFNWNHAVLDLQILKNHWRHLMFPIISIQKGAA
jgi:hypothetical protein